MTRRRRTVGVDAGGTFTDLALLDEDGLQLRKLRSTPSDPAEAVLVGLATLDPAAESAVVHGTTVATNAILERRGARTAFVATAGFRDLLTVGRGTRPQLYTLEPRSIAPLVPDELCFEVLERLGAAGETITPLSPSDAAEVSRAVVAAGAEAVAVCFLFSYLDPRHEQLMGAALEAAMGEVTDAAGVRGAHVSLSSAVLPVFRETERAATTAMNAYVAPVVSRYLERLEAGVAPRTLVVMASHGGVLSPLEASRIAASTVLSGPAAGVMGAKLVADRAGCTRFISLDMGGTSTDVALCDGDIPFRSSATVGGWPIHLPAVSIETVGAGGGSLVRADDSGAIWVGPHSAGAVPGPAAYGLGGTTATVTDAHVVLGRLPSAHALAGGLRLDPEAARMAMAAVARASGSTVEQAAAGAIDVANVVMERALRRVSVFEGHDPAAFTLLAFGGAGPLHVCELAEALGMRRALVPVWPGALSALGLATAAPRATTSRSIRSLTGARPDRSAVAGIYDELALEARRGAGGDANIEALAETRYCGQSSEISVPWPEGSDVAAAFHAAHEQRFGYSRAGAQIEVVTLRVRATGVPGASMPSAGRNESSIATSVRVVLPDGTSGDVPMVPRAGLRPGERVVGPAVLTQTDATTWVAPNWVGEIGRFGDLILERM